MEKLKYIDAWSSGLDVKLSYRDEKGRKHLETIKDYGQNDWYFYIRKFDYESMDPLVIEGFQTGEIHRSIEDGVAFVVEPGTDWVRVYVTNKNINERYSSKSDDRLRVKKFLEDDGIQVFEADLKLHKRYCLDEMIEVADNYRILYYDIEIDDRNPGIVIGRDKILTIAGVDQDGKVLFFHNEDEETLLNDFFEAIRWNYDILVGYNSDNFDKPYLEARFKEHFMEMQGQQFKYRMIHIDLMQVFIKRFAGDSEITSWSLDFISRYFLGHGKLEGGPTFGNGKGYAYYQENFKKFKEYNIVDARNLYDLNKVLSIVDQIILECQITGSFPSKFSISEMLDNYILRSVREKGIHFASIQYSENQVRCPKCNHVSNSDVPLEEIIGEIQCSGCDGFFEPNADEDIVGAHVFEPVPGLHRDVYVLDYKALYPSIIRTWNIGPDTLVEPIEREKIEQLEQDHRYFKSANDQLFFSAHTKVSAIKDAVERLLELRREYKTKMGDYKPGTENHKAYNAKQNAVKMLCNSVYGLMGYQYGRFYRKEIAEAITLGGQWLNKQTKKWFEARNYTVIYGDTDSVFINGMERSEVDNVLRDLHEYYDDALNEYFNVDRHFIELEYEKRFRKLILLKKKHYTGQLVELDGVETDKIVIKGLECIKRDTIPIAKRWQKELIDLLLKEDHPLSFYVKWVEKKRASFVDGNIGIDEIVIRKKLTKHPNKYKVKAIHVEIAKQMRAKSMEFYIGMPIPYIVTKEKPMEAVHPDWYVPGTASLDYYWDRLTFGVLGRILKVSFPSYDWDVFNTKTYERRKKKIDQFNRWFKDPKKKRPIVLKKLNEDKVLSENDKRAIKKAASIKTFKVEQHKPKG